MVRNAVTTAEEHHYTEEGRKGVDALFDVTCVIGTVYAGGEESPRNVAFRMIGQHDAEGQYRFPREDGGECIVTVEYTGGKGMKHEAEASWTTSN